MTKGEFLKEYFVPLDEDELNGALCPRGDIVIRYNGDYIVEYENGRMIVAGGFGEEYWPFDDEFMDGVEIFKQI